MVVGTKRGERGEGRPGRYSTWLLRLRGGTGIKGDREGKSRGRGKIEGGAGSRTKIAKIALKTYNPNEIKIHFLNLVLQLKIIVIKKKLPRMFG